MKSAVSDFLTRGLGVLVFAFGAVGQYRYGAISDPDAVMELWGLPIHFGFGGFLVILHMLKFCLYQKTRELWHTGRSFSWLCPSLICLLFALSGAVSTICWQVTIREGTTLLNKRSIDQEQDIRSELASLDTRLMIVGWARPVEQIEAELQAEKRHRRWEASSMCRAPLAAEFRTYCSGIDKMRGELAASSEATSLRKRATELRSQLLTSMPAIKPLGKDIVVLKAIFGATEETALLIRTGIFSVLIELAEVAFLVFLSGPASPGHGVKGPTGNASENEEASSGVSTCERDAARTSPMGAEERPSANAQARTESQENHTSSANIDRSPESQVHQPADLDNSRASSTSSGQTVHIDEGLAQPMNPPKGGRVAPSVPLANCPNLSHAARAAGSPTPMNDRGGHFERAPNRRVGGQTRPKERGETSAQMYARRLPSDALSQFVAKLTRGDFERATGTELAQHYERLREKNGWPVLANNTFGIQLKAAVEAVGGRKIKSGCQVYVGVGIPRVQLRVRKDSSGQASRENGQGAGVDPDTLHELAHPPGTPAVGGLGEGNQMGA